MTSSMPRVLQFCHGYDEPFLDCARQYASLFNGTDYRVTTVYLTGKPSKEVEMGSASDEVIFLGFSSKDIRGLKLSAISKIRKIAAEGDFRFCIAHRFKPIYIALLGTTLPVIGVHHAFGDYRRVFRRALVFLFRSRLTLLGVSNAVRDDIRACLGNWQPKRIETLYNRVDLHSLVACQKERTEARAFLNLPAEAWVVGNVGRLHPDKDQATLIKGFAEALPQLPNSAVLVIMGSGKLEQDLKRLVADLGLESRVLFLGHVAQARAYFKAFDLFVLTSDSEPFGMVLLEAMAAGIPLICTDCGGGREVVDGVGGLVPFGDVAALAARIVESFQFSSAEIFTLQQKMRERIKCVFSDEAARSVFWNMLKKDFSS